MLRHRSLNSRIIGAMKGFVGDLYCFPKLGGIK